MIIIEYISFHFFPSIYLSQISIAFQYFHEKYSIHEHGRYAQCEQDHEINEGSFLEHGLLRCGSGIVAVHSYTHGSYGIDYGRCY